MTSEVQAARWWRSIGDHALVGAIREGRAEAVDEFIRRFEDVVARYARQLQIPRHEHAHWIGDVLYEVAVTLGRGQGPVPRHLAAYVAGACRHRMRREHGDARARDALIYGAVGELDASGQAAVLETCSESSLRLASGAAWEPPALPPVLAQLAEVLGQEITAEERDILSWLGQHVSYTTIAGWLGIGRPAAVSRIQRLRARLIRTTIRFGESLQVTERVELLRFLHRAGVSESRLLAFRQDEVRRPEARDDQT